MYLYPLSHFELPIRLLKMSVRVYGRETRIGWDFGRGFGRVLSRSRFSSLFSFPSLSFSLRSHNLILILISQQPFIHSFFFHLPFHTSQEQDETAHGLLLTIRYWYMRIGIGIVRRTLADPDDPPAAPQENSGASSSPHSHDGLSDGPGPKEPRRRSPSSSERGTDISRVQPSPRKAPLHRFSMSRAERSTLPSRTLASNNLLTSLGLKKTSRLPAEET